MEKLSNEIKEKMELMLEEVKKINGDDYCSCQIKLIKYKKPFPFADEKQRIEYKVYSDFGSYLSRIEFCGETFQNCIDDVKDYAKKLDISISRS